MKISLIVPVYNVQDYVGECLDSLIKQSYTDIEIVCVNDGSTDGSRGIVAKHAEDDRRIVLIDQANGGLSAARNAGIAHATGDVVCFVDSDDCLEPHACETIAHAFSDAGTEALVFGATCFPAGTALRWVEDALSPRDAYYAEFKPQLLFEEKTTPYVWRTAVRKDKLDEIGLRFDETLRFGEDQVFLFALYPRVSGVRIISDKLYRYRTARSGSLMAGAVQDDVQKMDKDVAIAERIFANWLEGGFLDRYAADLVTWSVKFVGYGAMCQAPAARDRLVARIKRMWNETLGATRVESLQLQPHVRAMVNVFETFGDDGAHAIPENELRKIARSYRIKEYGWGDLVRTAGEKIKKKISR